MAETQLLAEGRLLVFRCSARGLIVFIVGLFLRVHLALVFTHRLDRRHVFVQLRSGRDDDRRRWFDDRDWCGHGFGSFRLLNSHDRRRIRLWWRGWLRRKDNHCDHTGEHETTAHDQTARLRLFGFLVLTFAAWLCSGTVYKYEIIAGAKIVDEGKCSLDARFEADRKPRVG